MTQADPSESGLKRFGLPIPVEIFDRLPVAIYATDSDGVVTYANQAAAQLVGRKAAIGIDRWCITWRLYDLNGALIPNDSDPLAQTIRQRRAVDIGRVYAERPDGSRVLIQPCPSLIFNEHGDVAGALNFLVAPSNAADGIVPTQEGVAAAPASHDAFQAARQLAAIVDSSDDAIIGQNLDGTITSWNRGAERLLGFTASEAIGQPIALIYPEGNKDDFRVVLDRIRAGERIDHYETTRRHKDGSPVEISLSVSPVRDIDGKIVGTAKIARDIGDRKRAEAAILKHAREQSALYRLTDTLFHSAPMDEVFEVAIDALAMASDCECASILMFDGTGTMSFVAWRGLSDRYRQAAAGHTPWKVGEPDAAPIQIENVETAEDLSALRPLLREEGIRSLGFFPISAGGGVVGKLMIYHREQHRFAQHELDVALTIAQQLGFGIERARAEAQRKLLVAELIHRVKNTLANVLSVAQQTFRRSNSREKSAFEGRILAMAQAHTRLAESSWTGVSLSTLLEDVLGPYFGEENDRISLDGPQVTLGPRAAVSLGMALNELATNALKYGALCADAGHVSFSWILKDGLVTASWVESGGPRVTSPRRSGFGRLILEKALATDLGGSVQMDFAPTGVVCTISFRPSVG